MQVLDKATQEVLFSKGEIADSFFKRLTGLLNKKNIDKHYALFFSKTNSVHTIGMKFAIDVIYTDEDNVILEIVESLKPYRMSFHRKASHLIEVEAGSAKRKELRVKQQLEIKL